MQATLLKVVKAMDSLTSSKIVRLFSLSVWILSRTWVLEEHKMLLNQEDDDLIIQEDSAEKFMNILFKWKFIVMMCK